MTVDPEEMCIPYMHLVMNAISISGRLPTSPALQRDMLEFSALHKILPVIETFAFTGDDQ
ncbi:hypothetical protein CDV31_004479 [Fusarium ambrosium]|uniref:Uncharacterized protein n=1 Tax=Fusarium ambrosium TaxID=131363 RepID=A0A428UR09_9HYPO|nr:hypothetical protein CDV31_004479 [Fusarium ambrosium]